MLQVLKFEISEIAAINNFFISKKAGKLGRYGESKCCAFCRSFFKFLLVYYEVYAIFAPDKE